MTYVSMTTKIKLELNVRINSWAKKTSWIQKKLKLHISSPEKEGEEHGQGAEEGIAGFCCRGSVMPSSC